MNLTMITIYYLCEEFLKTLHHRDDQQVRLTTAEVMIIALVVPAAFFGSNIEATRSVLDEYGYIEKAILDSRLCPPGGRGSGSKRVTDSALGVGYHNQTISRATYSRAIQQTSGGPSGLHAGEMSFTTERWAHVEAGSGCFLDFIPQSQHCPQGLHGRAAIVVLLRFREILVRYQRGMCFLVLIPSRPIAPAFGYPSLGPDLVRVLGQLFGQLEDLLTEVHLRGVYGLWLVNQVLLL
jgi:hypothetical protein